MNDDKLKLIAEWDRRLSRANYAHYESAKSLNQRHLWLGMPVVILTSIVSTSIFANNTNSNPNNLITIITGCVSLLAAILSAMQTFLKFSERAEKHRQSASQYSIIRRELEIIKSSSNLNEVELTNRLQIVKEKLDGLSNQAEPISPRIWNKAEALYSKEKFVSKI